MNIIKKSVLFLMACVVSVLAYAQSPILKKYTFSDHSYISKMSDNGKWAVTAPANADIICTPKLIDLTSGKDINIGSTTNDEGTSDVTDDGTIVVGSCQGKPAYWSKADGQWHFLELKSSQTAFPIAVKGGVAISVTPDGKYAVGELTTENAYMIAPALWDLKTGKTIITPNLPIHDMAHKDQNQMRFDAISADGRYICATMSMSYLPSSSEGDDEAALGGLFSFVYDIPGKSYKVIGFTESETQRWTPDYDGCFVVDGANMSNNGKYVVGACRIWRATDETTDYYIPYLYDVENDKFTAYEDESTRSNTAYTVTNDGVPLMASPEGSPYRNWFVYDGKRFWYAIEDILSQRWGYNLLQLNSYDNTGTPDAISDNGMRVLATPTYLDGDSYVIDFSDPVSSLINDQVSLLGSYTCSPAEGSEVSALASMNVTFTQNVKTIVTGNVVTLEDENDNVIATATRNMADGGKTLSIAFRRTKAKLEEGKTCYVHIPANTIAVVEAPEMTNDDIYIELKGRKNAPVTCTKVAPSDGTGVAKVDVNTNPITFDFDTDITIDPKETRKAYIYRNAETEPYAELNFYYGKNQVALAPSTTVNLFKDNTYRVVIPEGIITDVAGNGANKEISVTYQGAYERTVSFDDAYLFKNDFNSMDITTAFMLYDGDQKQPTDAMKAWRFNYSLPWYFCRTDNSSQDFAAVSHSMYVPAGKSDDWMVVPQLYIPDKVCELTFDSQSYKSNKDDRLKVYVWACDNVYSAMNKERIERIKTEGDLVYNEVQEPGASEDKLEGDWRANSVSLAKYAGKNVYIAFCNDNEDQSAVFVDNVFVKHNMPALISFDNEESVVGKDAVNVSGSIAANLEDKPVNDVILTLVDGDGKTIDTWTKTGLGMTKGKYTKFAFTKQLPLKKGVANRFKVLMNVDGQETEVAQTINNLVFQPVTRVVLEEFTGRDCSNCPLGLVAIDNLKKRFGNRFLPIGIHGYTGDPLGNGLSDYYKYLGLSAAPSARINRSDSIMSPMVKDADNTYYLSAKALESATGYTTDDLWSDKVEEEILKPALSEVSATINYDEATRTITAPTVVRYAMNAENQNISIFAVLLEQKVDNIYQQNGFSSVKQDILLPWASGGEYAQPYVVGVLSEDVCRGTWGSTFLGNSGLIPTNIVAGQNYEVNGIEFQLPEAAKINPKNCQVVVMMFDANTGKYINAVRTDLLSDATGINAVVDKENAKNVDNAWYTLSGLKLNQKPKAAGLYIHQGKKYVIK